MSRPGGRSIGPTLQHDDLHPGNVFAARHDSAPVFFDWGDSVIGHPFATMLVTLRVVKYLAKVDDADAPFGWLGHLLDVSYLGDISVDDH